MRNLTSTGVPLQFTVKVIFSKSLMSCTTFFKNRNTGTQSSLQFPPNKRKFSLLLRTPLPKFRKLTRQANAVSSFPDGGPSPPRET